MDIQPKKFKYTLDIRGVEEEVLFNAPEGWLQTNIKYVRSKQYGGIIRSLTLPLKFVKSGAKLLRKEYYKYRLLSTVNLFIYKLDPASYLYKQLYFGKLDFSKFSDDLTGVTVNATENNVNVRIDAFADVEYAIPLTLTTDQANAWRAARGYDAMVDVLLTPLKLQETASLIINTSPDFRMNAFFQLSIADYQQMAVSPSIKGTGFLQQGPPDFTNNPNYFFVAQTDTKIRFNSGLDGVTGLPVPNQIQTSVNGLSGGGSADYQFNIYNQSGTLLKTLAQTGPVSATIEFLFSFDFSLDVQQGDKLFFYIKNVISPTLDDGVHHGVNIQSGSIQMTYYTSTPASHCQALRASYVFDYLIQQMNGSQNAPVQTQSFLLENELKQLTITCSNSILVSQAATIYQAGEQLQFGNHYKVFGGKIHYVDTSGVSALYIPGDIFKAILGHPTFTTDPDQDGFVQQEDNNPQLIYSYNNFFKSIYAVKCAQMGTGIDPGTGKYVMEDLTYFYRSSGVPALDLGDSISTTSKFSEPNLDISVNTISIGYANQQYAPLNSGQEVGSTQNYATILPNPVKKLDVISPTRMDPFGIEERRILPGYNRPSTGLSGTFYLNSASSRSDNDNFFVWVNKVPEAGQSYYQPLRTEELKIDNTDPLNPIPMIYGVPKEYYNWRLSPKQNLLRGSNYLASVFYQMNGQKIVSTSALKNANMVTVDDAGRRVGESDSVNISDLGNPIFLPYYDTLETGLQFNAEELLSLNPFDEIWYNYKGTIWKAYIEECSVDEGENSPQSFKVKLSPNNNMSKRIF